MTASVLDTILEITEAAEQEGGDPVQYVRDYLDEKGTHHYNPTEYARQMIERAKNRRMAEQSKAKE